MIIGDAVQSVFSIVMMIGVGYILTHKGWFDGNISKLFSKLVVRVSLPALMFSNLMKNFNKDILMESKIGIGIAFSTMFLSYGISILIARVLKIPPKRKGLFQSMFALSNTIFIGLPVNLALFGEKSVPMVLLYYIANTTTFWTIGVYYIRKDSGNDDGEGIFTMNTLKRIFSPPLMGFLVALIFIILKINPPKFIMDSCRYIGNLTTAISMFFIGIIIHSLHIKDIYFDKNMIVLLIGRFVFCPLLVLTTLYYFEVPLLMEKVFVIEAAMPVMTQSAIVAQAYGADYKYATVMVSVTTMASLLFIPLYTILLSL
ncbi:AEC family transporter [Crassaminicella profunda]|uniref:AEC family transporter n=1 Tax=Crassaminicella profunda TaxID=1286698 RepID=UPI001CA76F9D|nr:AEC family transporter [Crassaminicella profunda]QZY54988.1 AEC family transporter [Crassaminicella profunda]